MSLDLSSVPFPAVKFGNSLMAELYRERIYEPVRVEPDGRGGFWVPDRYVVEPEAPTPEADELFPSTPYQRLVNRLKIMADINPVPYPDTRVGKIRVRFGNGATALFILEVGPRDAYLQLCLQPDSPLNRER